MDTMYGVNFLRLTYDSLAEDKTYFISWQSAEFTSFGEQRNIYDNIVKYKLYNVSTNQCIIDDIDKDDLSVDVTSLAKEGAEFTLKTVVNVKGDNIEYDVETPQYPIKIPESVDIPGNDSQGNTKLPRWIDDLSPEDKEKIISSDFFKSWLKTTTTLHVDLTKCTELRGKVPIPISDIVWRDDSLLLFHGNEEGRPVSEIIKQGLTPPEPYGDFVIHQPTHFKCVESTSYSFYVTIKFALPDSTIDSYEKGVRDSYVYLINAPGGVDVDKTYKEDPEYEVAFPGGVSSEYVIGAFIFRKNDSNKSILVDFNYFDNSIISPPETEECYVFICFMERSETILTIASNDMVISGFNKSYIKLKTKQEYTFTFASKYNHGIFINGENNVSNTNSYSFIPADHQVNGVLVIEWNL